RPHQAGPFVIPFAQERSYPAIRSIFQFVTSGRLDHEVVIKGPSAPAGGPYPGIGTADSADGRLITLIAQARIRRRVPEGGPLQHHCPAFARCCPKIPSFRRAVDTGRGLFSWLGGGQWGDSIMTIKASARSALILAAGLLVSFAAPPPAMAAGTDADSAAVSKPESATSGKSVRQGSRYLKKRYAQRKHPRAASKSAESKKADEKRVADASGATPPAMPEWLANANAQMTAADAAPDGAKDTAKAMSAAMSEKANTVLQAAADKPADGEAPPDTAAAAPDQLNEADRALHNDVDKALQE